MTLEVVDVSGLVTIQDSGRNGWRKFGVPVSGPMDWFAFQAANHLVGNSLEMPVLELGFGEVAFRALRDCVIAVTGAGYEVQNYIWTFPLWTSFYVRSGWNVSIRKTTGGNLAYLAMAGGIDAQRILSSRSTYLRGGMGQTLQSGTRLKILSQPRDLQKLAARVFSALIRPKYSQSPVIEVIPGPQSERFTRKGIETFYSSAYALGRSFDRMGYRLEGTPIEHSRGADMISEGMTMGSVQVPASGQPMVMMADGPTTGGYPKIATVIRADLPVLAQCESGIARIVFKETSVEMAQAKYKKMSLVSASHENAA